MKVVAIYQVELVGLGSGGSSKLNELREKVNQALKDARGGGSVQWLQSSGCGSYSDKSFTHLTAIVISHEPSG